MNRPTLTLRGNPGGPYPSEEGPALALVGEAPGPNGNPETPLWPSPSGSAAGRLCAIMGMGKGAYLRMFARANLLDAYPGPVFPLARARPLAVPLAQRLAPLPLILLGRGVQAAFSFPEPTPMEWVDYQLGDTWIRAAALPHPSGRSLYYNDALKRAEVGSWLREQVAVHRPK